MVNSSKKAIAILATVCLLFGVMGYAPEIKVPTAKAATKVTRYVKTCTAKVYAATGTSATVVKTLKRNKEVTQYGSSNDGWAKISYATGKTGYILSKKLSKKPVDLIKAAKAELKMLGNYARNLGYGNWSSDYAHDPYPGENTVFRAEFLNNAYHLAGFAKIYNGSGWIHYNVEIRNYWDGGSLITKKKNITMTAYMKLLKKYEFH